MNNTALLFNVSEGIAHAKQLSAELRSAYEGLAFDGQGGLEWPPWQCLIIIILQYYPSKSGMPV